MAFHCRLCRPSSTDRKQTLKKKDKNYVYPFILPVAYPGFSNGGGGGGGGVQHFLEVSDGSSYLKYSNRKVKANSLDPNQTPQNAASDPGLYCLPHPAIQTLVHR